jgi:hypothetical protein
MSTQFYPNVQSDSLYIRASTSIPTLGGEVLRTSKKTHSATTEIFAGMSALGLALTTYTVFGLTAAPATIITAFAFSAGMTAFAGTGFLASLWSTPTGAPNPPVHVLPSCVTTPEPVEVTFDQQSFWDVSFVSSSFNHQQFFAQLGVSLYPRDWTQKILRETEHMAISEIARKWPQLFLKGVLQKSDILFRLHREIAEIGSFKQLIYNYPPLFFEMGFITRETRRIDLLVHSHIVNYPELYLDHREDEPFKIIVKYGLAAPAILDVLGRIDASVSEIKRGSIRRQEAIKQEFVSALRSLENRRTSDLDRLESETQLSRQTIKLEKEIVSIREKLQLLRFVTAPDTAYINDLDGRCSRLRVEVQEKENLARTRFESKKLEKERLCEWLKYNSLDIQKTEDRIKELEIELEKTKQPVTGIGAAWQARSNQRECEARLQDERQLLKNKLKVDGYQINPVIAQNRLQELSVWTKEQEERELNLPFLRASFLQQQQKLDTLKAEQKAYQSCLKLQGEEAALVRTLSSLGRPYTIFSPVSWEVERRYAEQKQIIEKNFATSKRALEEGKRREELSYRFSCFIESIPILENRRVM